MAEPDDGRSASVRDLVEALVMRFALAHDEGDLQAIGDCVTHDVTVEYAVRGVHTEPEVSSGREAIVGRVANSHRIRAHPRRHQMSNVLVTGHPREGELDVLSYLTLWELYADRPPMVLAAGCYEDRVVITGGTARFRRRRITLENTPPSTPAVRDPEKGES